MAETLPGVQTGAAVSVTITGLPELMTRLADAGAEMPRILREAMTAALLVVKHTSQLKYLSGPRPTYLAPSSAAMYGRGAGGGYLRASIGVPAKEGIFEIRGGGTTITGAIGTRVRYGWVHEEGATLHPTRGPYLRFYLNGKWISARSVTIPARPFLRTALADSEQEISKVFNDRVQELLDKIGK